MYMAALSFAQIFSLTVQMLHFSQMSSLISSVQVLGFVQVFGLTSVNTAAQPSHTPTDSKSTCVPTVVTGRINAQTAVKGFLSQHT